MYRIAQISLTSLLSVALFTACNSREIASVEPLPDKEEFKDIPVDVNRDIDMLFLIDNSGSMLEEQTSLAANFPEFIRVLQNIEGGLPNIHLGVISTDMGAGPWVETGCSANGDNGGLRTNATCGVNNAYIEDLEDPNGGRITNYSGTLEETFSCMARLGTTGCGFEQPLKAMQKALDGSNPANNGFLRENAYLAIVFVTDEDDCSVTDNNMFDTTQTDINSDLGPLSSFRCFEFGVTCDDDSAPRAPGQRLDCAPRTDSRYMTQINEHVEFLKGLKNDPNQVIVAGIIGDPAPVTVTTDPEKNNIPVLAPSCVSPSGEAAPGVRLQYFFEQFPGRSTVTTICNEDLTNALLLIAELLKKVIGNPCLEGNIDISPDPGVQYECQVSDVQYPDTPAQTETVIPNCADSGGARPCYELQPNLAQCPDTETNMELIINRDGDPAPGTHVQARCVVL